MFTGFLQLSPTDIRRSSDTKEMTLGSVGVTRDGRVYRYSQAGAADLAPGKLSVAATANTDVANVTVAASVTASASAKQVVIDAGGAIVQDAYADGHLTINDATGEGVSYAVRGNTVTSGAAELTVDLDEPVVVSLTVDVSEATLTKNPWKDTVISATDQADLPVGVPNVTIGDTEYGWSQTRGVCAVWADEAFAAGDALVTGSGVAGQVEAQDTDDTKAVVGVGILAPNAATEYPPVYLTID